MLKFNSLNMRIWSKLGQRGSFFGVAVFEILKKNKDTYITTADLAYLSGLERFISKYPENFVNVGIAEQNMLGISAGLAQEGNSVFATTYATFVSMRSCEQIRHYMGYMQSNIKVVGTGAGFIMTYSGNTHYTIEDLSIIRAIPNIVILSPADATETVKVALAASDYEGPVYIRLTGGLNNPMVYKEDYEFKIGKAVVLSDGEDITVFATGSMVYNALQAAKEIENKEGIKVNVVNIHTIKPIDEECIENMRKKSKLFVSVEEHNKIGGLGATISECITDSTDGNYPPLLRLGIEDKFFHAGDYEYLQGVNRLLPQQIAEDILIKYHNL